MAITQVNVPDIGGSEGAEVIELLVSVGDEIVIDQGLIVLESDKASMEIPSTVAGKVVEVLVAEGDQLVEGSPLARIEVADAADVSAANNEPAAPQPSPTGQAPADAAPVAEADEAPAAETDEAPAADGTTTQVANAQTPTQAPAAAAPAQAAAAQSTAHTTAHTTAEPAAPARASVSGARSAATVYAGPAVRKLAREFGVPLDEVAGTGPHGRVLKEDVQGFVSQALQAPPAGGALPVVPDIDFAQFGEVEASARSKLDKLTAANMQRSWLNVPHVTQFDEADISDLEAFRNSLRQEAEQRELRLSPLPFILKACAVALREHPRLNSSLARGGEDLVHKHYVHIGMAVDTPAGLVVPVIRDVDRKSVWELAAEVGELAERARARKLKPGEMQGGSFTVSSLGNIGGRGFTPIVNTPEVAILGVSRAAVQPVWDGTAFVPRTLLPLALSYDHRVVNGGDGGRFLTRLVALLGDIRRLSL